MNFDNRDTLTAYTRDATKLVFYIAKQTELGSICASENERLRVNRINHLELYIGEPSGWMSNPPMVWAECSPYSDLTIKTHGDAS